VLGISEVPPLFVMSQVPGESYEPAFARDPPTVSVEQLRQRAFSAATVAAALHAVDVTDPRIASERVGDPAAEVERWARAFASVDDDLRAGHERVREALLAQLPDALPPSVLHGDFRLGNMQCQGGQVEALIDWEIWSLGDRRLDLAWFLLNSDPNHPNSQRAETGLPEPAALIATYGEASGVPMEGLFWFGALVRYNRPPHRC
jgi:aminoglycoside phosphotransferase (APT) family kinase protein